MTDPESPKGGPEEDIAQRLERSLDFWAAGKEDYPPAIRGTVAEIADFQPEVQALIQRIGRDPGYPDLALQRVLWFDDKNDKLDDACSDAKVLFRPWAVDADGLVSLSNTNNPALDKPTRHRLRVSEQFAATNYRSGKLIEDSSLDSEREIGEKSWKRKITQTLKPWAVRKAGKLEYVRPSGDLLLALNALYSRTKHGWLVVDMYKLRERRGAMLTYARTFDLQREDGRAYEFKVELFGAAAEVHSRLAAPLNNLAALYLDIDGQGDIYVRRAAAFPPSSPPELDRDSRTPIPLDARICLDDDRPSQIVLKRSGKYYESKLKPLFEQGKPLSTKIDLRKAESSERRYRFVLRLELNSPLLVATSGDAVLFRFDDLLTRFAGTDLAMLRGAARPNS
jgi:hypothetical protein